MCYSACQSIDRSIKSDYDSIYTVPVDIIDRALECFHDHYVSSKIFDQSLTLRNKLYEVHILVSLLKLKVYSSCEEAYRLHPEGAIHVPPEAVDEYCEGPCLKEAKLVLKCIDGILYDFKFYNGASIRDVSYTLATGCGHTGRRGKAMCRASVGSHGVL